MEIITAKDYTEMSQIAADIFSKRVRQDAKLTLGLATGGTPIETYKCLTLDHQKNQTSYQKVTTFNLDEYIGLEPTDHNSYQYYMKTNLFNHIDIPKQQTHIPNGKAENPHKECETYDQQITVRGGIDLQLLGIGSNGHIGFNEPGTSFDTATHVENLTTGTREANARFFNSIDEVPKQAITMGIGTIMRSKEILLIVSGESKSKALARLLEGEIDPSFPASVLKKHAHVTIVADTDALKYTNAHYNNYSNMNS